MLALVPEGMKDYRTLYISAFRESIKKSVSFRWSPVINKDT